MRYVALLALLMLTSPTRAQLVDDGLAQGLLGLRWGSTLEQVAQRYAGGLPYPTTIDYGTYMAYDIDVDADLFGLPDLLPRARFCFNANGRLHKVFLQYLPEQHEQVLNRVINSLGQNYSTHATKERTIYEWSMRSGPTVGLSIGKTSPKDWVILMIDPEPDTKR